MVRIPFKLPEFLSYFERIIHSFHLLVIFPALRDNVSIILSLRWSERRLP